VEPNRRFPAIWTHLTGSKKCRRRQGIGNLCSILPGSGRCGLIDGAVTVVESSLRTFPEEYEAQLLRVTPTGVLKSGMH
jgi:hypothetical protein